MTERDSLTVEDALLNNWWTEKFAGVPMRLSAPPDGADGKVAVFCNQDQCGFDSDAESVDEAREIARHHVDAEHAAHFSENPKSVRVECDECSYFTRVKTAERAEKRMMEHKRREHSEYANHDPTDHITTDTLADTYYSYQRPMPDEQFETETILQEADATVERPVEVDSDGNVIESETIELPTNEQVEVVECHRWPDNCPSTDGYVPTDEAVVLGVDIVERPSAVDAGIALAFCPECAAAEFGYARSEDDALAQQTDGDETLREKFDYPFGDDPPSTDLEYTNSWEVSTSGSVTSEQAMRVSLLATMVSISGMVAYLALTGALTAERQVLLVGIQAIVTVLWVVLRQ